VFFCLIMIKFPQKGRLYINIYVIICIIIFICFYIYRMQMYFPDVEPLVYREDNLLAYIRGVIKLLK
jgi:hypothetical protein